jgi:hypothetical protein
MLWSQYKSATMTGSEFLRKQITGIPSIANWNSDFLTLQTLKIQKKIQPESLESKTESEFRLRWVSQKLEPKIGIPNQGYGLICKKYPKWDLVSIEVGPYGHLICLSCHFSCHLDKIIKHGTLGSFLC